MKKKIVVISAIWCPSCLILKKHLKKLKSEYSDIEIETFDYDLDEEIVKTYDIGNTLPVMISESNNNEIGRLVGEKKYDEIIAFLKGSEII